MVCDDIMYGEFKRCVEFGIKWGCSVVIKCRYGVDVW